MKHHEQSTKNEYWSLTRTFSLNISFFQIASMGRAHVRRHHLKITHSKSNNNKENPNPNNILKMLSLLWYCAIDRTNRGCLECEKDVIAVRSPNKMIMVAIEESFDIAGSRCRSSEIGTLCEEKIVHVTWKWHKNHRQCVDCHRIELWNFLFTFATFICV